MASDYSQLREVNVRLVKMMMEREAIPSKDEMRALLAGLPGAWLMEALDSGKNIVGQDRDIVIRAIENELWVRSLISTFSKPSVDNSPRPVTRPDTTRGSTYFKVAIV